MATATAYATTACRQHQDVATVVADIDAVEVRQPASPKPPGLFSRLKSMGRRRSSYERSGTNDSPEPPSSKYGTTYQPSCREGVLDTLVALKSYGVHVVYAGTGDGEPPAVLGLSSEGAEATIDPNSTKGLEVEVSAADPLVVPEDTEAVLVLADPQYPHAASHLLHEFKSRTRRSPSQLTVVAMLLQPPDAPKDLSLLVGATSVLAVAPGDDIIMQPGTKDDLPAILAMIMEKVERKAKADQLAQLANGGPARNKRPSAISTAEPRSGAASPVTSPPAALSGLQSPTSGSDVLEPSSKQLLNERHPTDHGSRRASDPKPGGQSPSSSSSSSSSRREGKSSSHQASMWDECRLLRRLRHPNIVCVQDIVDAKILKPLKGAGAPNLRRAISGQGGQLPAEMAQSIFWQISCGVAYIHDQRIAHRNLKPEAIMVENGAVKIANFNLAVKLGSNSRSAECRDKCGTMPFVAPEVLAGRRYDASAADVWSMGVVLLEMLCGIHKLPRMLGWTNTPTPSYERAMDIEAFFLEPTELLASIEADLGNAPAELLKLAPHVLCVLPSARWPASSIRDSDWVSAGASRSPEPQDQRAPAAAEEEEDYSLHSERSGQDHEAGAEPSPIIYGD